MLLGLRTQLMLRAVTRKYADKPSVTFDAIGVTLQLTLRFGHLYYKIHERNDYFFSMV